MFICSLVLHRLPYDCELVGVHVFSFDNFLLQADPPTLLFRIALAEQGSVTTRSMCIPSLIEEGFDPHPGQSTHEPWASNGLRAVTPRSSMNLRLMSRLTKSAEVSVGRRWVNKTHPAYVQVINLLGPRTARASLHFLSRTPGLLSTS